MSDATANKTLSKTPAATPASKPATVELTPASNAVPSFVSAIPAGAKVFVLVPSDGVERQVALDKLEDELFKYFEDVPPVNHEWKAARLPFGSVILPVHCVSARARRDDGTFGPVAKLHIGQPVEIDAFRAKAQDGYSFSTNLAGIVDAVTASCKHTGGTVWLATLSGDPIAEDRVLKLVKS